jgi:hypothetical protein
VASELDLVLHVGLPKTATTTLQTHVFPRFDGYLRSERLFNSAMRAWLTQSCSWQDVVGAWGATIGQDGRTTSFVSQEALSMWPQEPNDRPLDNWPLTDRWSTLERSRPHPLLAFIEAVRLKSKDNLTVRVILALRNQSDFMGSLYAQLSGRLSLLSAPSQQDFEAKVRAIINSDDTFFDWSALVAELDAALGRKNCLILFYEDGLERNIQHIEEFLGTTFGYDGGGVPKENVRLNSYGTWTGDAGTPPIFTQRGFFKFLRLKLGASNLWLKKLRRAEELLRLVARILDAVAIRFFKPQPKRQPVSIAMPDALSAAVRRHFARSNAHLEVRMRRNLAVLGY